MVFNDTDGVYTYTFEAEKKVWHLYCAIFMIIILLVTDSSFCDHPVISM